MPVSLEIQLDAAFSQRISALWHELKDCDIGDDILSFFGHPHITLVLSSNIAERVLSETADEVASEMHEFPIIFTSIGLFPGEKITLFLNPVPSVRLALVHEKVLASLEIKDANVSDRYAIGSWCPHCTVAFNVDRIRIDEVLKMLDNIHYPSTGIASFLSVVSYPGGNIIHTYRLIPENQLARNNGCK